MKPARRAIIRRKAMDHERHQRMNWRQNLANSYELGWRAAERYHAKKIGEKPNAQ